MVFLYKSTEEIIIIIEVDTGEVGSAVRDVNPREWRDGVPACQTLWYAGVWSGMDMVWYG